MEMRQCTFSPQISNKSQKKRTLKELVNDLSKSKSTSIDSRSAIKHELRAGPKELPAETPEVFLRLYEHGKEDQRRKERMESTMSEFKP